jgi:adenosine deaminase
MLPKLAQELAIENNLTLSNELFDGLGFYDFTTFEEFLKVYNRVGAVVRRAGDLELIARAYLRSASAEGAVYVELMLSPMHSIANGISFEEQVEAVAKAAAAVPAIETCLIVTALRHHGPTEAESTARLAAEMRHPIVRGFGLTGDELRFGVSEFRRAFQIAKDAGLQLTAHAGEWGTARSVLDAVECLSLSRVGHGISAIGDPQVVVELAARRVGFEICQTANAVLGAHKSAKPHPIAQLAASGCRIVLGTDDPAYFRTSIGQEYDTAARVLTSEQFAQIAYNAVELAFCCEETRHRLRKLATAAYGAQ